MLNKAQSAARFPFLKTPIGQPVVDSRSALQSSLPTVGDRIPTRS
jgi:hypothetical protein